jgi:hypothetical protein
MFYWKNIYGSPLSVSGDNAKMMNSNSDLGSLWKGRILIQVYAEKTEKPILKLQNIADDECLENASKFFNLNSYAINC